MSVEYTLTDLMEQDQAIRAFQARSLGTGRKRAKRGGE
jgi:hypothetical protein